MSKKDETPATRLHRTKRQEHVTASEETNAFMTARFLEVQRDER